jgi:hypothetical protein
MARYTNKLVTILFSTFSSLGIGRTIVEGQVSNMMISFELLQHVVSADLPALVNGVK